ncbi:MAG: SUMF1/EgtB/PvdO family nonheme iron enzyme [Chloroflexi bacterium]|nr:SUMF1/EgtB/PvdO family nonheme iron enzyme [Chloroflexota bacterium]
MADPVLFKIFLSSPSDVPQERGDAEAVIADINASGEFAHHFILKLFRWDDKSVVLPMPVTEIPQKSVDIYMIRPSACDVAVVLFWSRMGSPLVMDEREYLSGTHYEYSEALQGYLKAGKPTLWLYRCAEEPLISLKDPKRAEKNHQFDQVDQFFKQFQDSQGRYTGGVNEYSTHAEFKSLFEGQLLTYLRHMRDNPRPIDGLHPKRTILPDIIPYRGLTALDEGDAPIFFGRDSEALEVLSRVNMQRLVFVLGASGSGKSSLVAAGVLPKLSARGWHIVRCVPGDDPFYAVALALVKLPMVGISLIDALPSARKLANTLRESPTHLVEQISLMLPDNRIVLFIDQFEELFTLADKNSTLPAGSVTTFIQAIRQPSVRLVTLLAMRADFYGVALPYFSELERDTYGLRQPTPFALYEMITRPAELAGLKLDNGLAEQIVADVAGESGALALISYVLEALYVRAKSRGDGRLTRQDYEVELKGVREAINTLAEKAYADLPLDATTKSGALKAVFRELIALTEEDGQLIPSRRRAPLTNFPIGSNAARLIKAFVGTRLLVMDSQTVEVAHEAILRHWEALADWIAAIKGDLALYRQYERDAKNWDQRGRDMPQPAHEALVYFERTLVSLGYERETLPEPLKTYTEPEHARLERELETLPLYGKSHARRRDIGDRLAVIEDKRSGVGVKGGMPEIAWLPINESLGQVEFKDQRGKTYGNFSIQPFFIAKYLVTYSQFDVFLQAKDGFQDDRWWVDMQDEYKRQAMMQQWTRNANAPRDSISWYQCVAFARWLNNCLFGLELTHPAGIILRVGDNAEVRLPSEWEWQWLAEGGKLARSYPWGSVQEGCANTSESGLSRTIAVGMYPHGGANCGALDVSGNLWEWCLNDYDLPETVSARSEEEKVLRGGSFNSYLNFAASSARYGNGPSIRSANFGLRLAVSFPMGL